MNVYGASDIGRVRASNQDRWMSLPEEGFFALADGMGGHLGGDVAAETTLAALSEFIKANISLTLEQGMSVLSHGIALANQAVHQRGMGDQELHGMGSTLCCLQLIDHEMVYAHVGDSRVYLKRDGQLRQLTTDHSLVGLLYTTGEISVEEAEAFEDTHKITRAIGPRASVAPSVDHIRVRKGDLFLLCSDGLSDPVSFPALEAILNSCNGCQRLVQRLIQAAKDAGGEDNITAVLVEIEDV